MIYLITLKLFYIIYIRLVYVGGIGGGHNNRYYRSFVRIAIDLEFRPFCRHHNVGDGVVLLVFFGIIPVGVTACHGCNIRVRYRPRHVHRRLPVQQVVQVLRYPVQHVVATRVDSFGRGGRRQLAGLRQRFPTGFHVHAAHDDGRRRHHLGQVVRGRRLDQTDFDANVRGQHVGRRLDNAPDGSIAASRQYVHEVRLHQLPTAVAVVVHGYGTATAVERHYVRHSCRFLLQQWRTTIVVVAVDFVAIAVINVVFLVQTALVIAVGEIISTATIVVVATDVIATTAVNAVSFMAVDGLFVTP